MAGTLDNGRHVAVSHQIFIIIILAHFICLIIEQSLICKIAEFYVYRIDFVLNRL